MLFLTDQNIECNFLKFATGGYSFDKSFVWITSTTFSFISISIMELWKSYQLISGNDFSFHRKEQTCATREMIKEELVTRLVTHDFRDFKMKDITTRLNSHNHQAEATVFV